MTGESEDHRFPWKVTALIVVLVLAATTVAGVFLAGDRVGSDQPVAAASPSPTATAPAPLALEDGRQVTLLLTVRDDDRAAVSSVLIGVGGGTEVVSELLLPRDLLLPTSPPIRLEQVDDPTGPRTAEEPLETLLGVQVDAIVDLDRLAWNGLVDATGSRVDPAAAERPGSFPLVLDPVLKGLPYSPQTVGELLTGLGSMARTTVTNEDASTLLSLVGRHLRSLEVRRETLPVTYLRSGAARVAVTDLAAADALVRELFAGALLQPGHSGQPRVVLQRAGATLGAATAARVDLVSAGYGVVLDPTEQELAAASAVLVPGGSEPALATGRAVAQELGLPAAAVQIDPSPEATVDARVVLGPDAVITRP